ncbi:glycosyltransferase [Thalassotalea fonticola]|uniref:Glycosyltransferase n=1 Tax=Thalassotalea fonticola TaxID=3065649 RepID=A0ABZ0GL93_9GAMM|nr:glycosyltransferase [Colwelliaceae bacterium S1-1]
MKKVLVISNLYPSDWQPNKATFNKQQFDHLSKHCKLSILVPVAWPEWLRANKTQRRPKVSECGIDIRYPWYFYTPKMFPGLYSVFMLLSLLINSWRWIKRSKHEVLLASWAYPEGVVTSCLAKLLRKGFFIKVHGSDINDSCQYPLRAKQVVWACNQAQGVIAVSEALKKRLVSLGVKKDKVHLIYNGVDKEIFYADQQINRQNYLLYVGNLKANKGVTELISAFVTLRAKHPNLTLKVAGTGPMLPVMQKEIAQAGLNTAVDFLGSVAHKNIANLIRPAKLVILPSYAEGVPNIILESIACGTPVVSTTVGGIPEVVNSKVGVLVAPKNVEALTLGIETALNKTWSSNEISIHAAKFDWDLNALALAEQLLTNKRSLTKG